MSNLVISYLYLCNRGRVCVWNDLYYWRRVCLCYWIWICEWRRSILLNFDRRIIEIHLYYIICLWVYLRRMWKHNVCYSILVLEYNNTNSIICHFHNRRCKSNLKRHLRHRKENAQSQIALRRVILLKLDLYFFVIEYKM